VEAVIGNLRSWTGYVQYVQKHGSEPGWVDPAEVLREKIWWRGRAKKKEQKKRIKKKKKKKKKVKTERMRYKR
jgi:hypothetical protein